jgi:hypothetical protein
MAKVFRRSLTGILLLLAVFAAFRVPAGPSEPSYDWRQDRDTHLITAYDTSPRVSPTPSPTP